MLQSCVPIPSQGTLIQGCTALSSAKLQQENERLRKQLSELKLLVRPRDAAQPVSCHNHNVPSVRHGLCTVRLVFGFRVSESPLVVRATCLSPPAIAGRAL